VLRYLPTTLSFALIADKLGISRGAATSRPSAPTRTLLYTTVLTRSIGRGRGRSESCRDYTSDDTLLCCDGQGGANSRAAGPGAEHRADRGAWVAIWVDEVDRVYERCIATQLEATASTDRRDVGRAREMHVRPPDRHVFRVRLGAQRLRAREVAYARTGRYGIGRDVSIRRPRIGEHSLDRVDIAVDVLEREDMHRPRYE
jgi:hypothetical protein